MSEEQVKRREGRQVWVDDVVLDRVAVIAAAARRSIAAQTTILLEEALAARAASPVSDR